MAITNENLLKVKAHPLGGEQRIYRFEGGFGLSVVNPPMLHAYPFAWEIAVIKGVDDDGKFTGLIYDTELSNDVEVFDTDEETNAFIERAAKYFASRAKQNSQVVS